MKHRIPIIALALLMTSCLAAEPTTQPATKPAGQGKDSAIVKELALRFLKAMREDDIDTLKGLSAGAVQGWIEVNWKKSARTTNLNFQGQPPAGWSVMSLKDVASEIRREVFARNPDAAGKVIETVIQGDYAATRSAFITKSTCLVLVFVRTQQGWRFATLDNGRVGLEKELAKHMANIPRNLKILRQLSNKSTTQPVVLKYVRRIRATLPKGWSVQTEKDTVMVNRKKPVEWYGLFGLPTHDKAKLKAMGGFVHSMTYFIDIRFAPPMSKAEAARLALENKRTSEKYYRKHPVSPSKKATAPPAELTDALHPIPDILNDKCSMFLDVAISQGNAFYDKADEAECRKVEQTVLKILKSNNVKDRTTRPATQPAVETQMSQIAQKRLRQKIPKITFDKNKLADTIQFFRELANLNIVVNWKSLESAKINKATPVSLNLLNSPTKDVLEQMFENARKIAGGKVAPDYVVDEEGVITVAMPKHLRLDCKITPPKRPTEKSRRTHKRLMQTMPKVSLPDVGFADVVQFLSEYSNTRIVVDFKALKSAGIDKKTLINLYLINVSGKKALEKTLDIAGGLTELSCVIDEEGVIQISTKKTATTTSAPAVDPKVMAVLKRLEEAGTKYPNITANIDYKVDMLQTGDTESRTGKVYYQGPTEKTPAKFRIHFDTLRQGTGPKIKYVVDYAYDGEWLTERKERIKQMNRYQVPKGTNLLQLGKGPFPVPFGQKAQAVIKYFRPTTRPVKKADPKNTDYIKLTTRQRYRKDFSVVWLEMWVDHKSGLPVKIVTEDRSENVKTIIFKDTKTPKSFDKKIFTLPRPPAGWEYHVERFKGKVKP